MGLSIFFWSLTDPENAFLYGFVTFMIIYYAVRMLVPRSHRNGMKKIKKENYNDGIPLFEKSYAFFSKNNWLDKYRFVTILSASKITYKEMALNNIAYCYSQIGNGNQSKAYYERTLKEFPESVLAKSGLNMLNSMITNTSK
jgi:tetratricopeptide (TPR) repeat protein